MMELSEIFYIADATGHPELLSIGDTEAMCFDYTPYRIKNCATGGSTVKCGYFMTPETKQNIDNFLEIVASSLRSMDQIRDVLVDSDLTTSHNCLEVLAKICKIVRKYEGV